MARDHAAQLLRKEQWVERSLNRALDKTTASPQTLGYRARVRLVPDDNGRLGFHPPRSHSVIAVSNCPIAYPAINRCLAAAPSIPRQIDYVGFRTNGAEVVIDIETHPRHREETRNWASQLQEADFGGAALAVNGKTVRGDTKLSLLVAGIEHRLSPGTFFQINLAMNASLVDTVLEAVAGFSPAQVLDTYAGAGNLSLPLAARGVGVTQIESHPSACADAKATAKRHGLTVDTRRQRAQDFQAGDAFFDVAIVDPPRAGAGALMPRLLMTRPSAVMMISCNPPTLARDVRAAEKCGYSLQRLEMFDMFPHTEHTECFGVLVRD
jgi:23S rRNA (uracil1939-C5)-methyltransferase